MKQSEKNQKSRALILTHAFTEFASHGYEGSSLNQICARGNLSKGLLYHYYKNKDALYLSCVHVLFDDMTPVWFTALSASGGSSLHGFGQFADQVVAVAVVIQEHNGSLVQSRLLLENRLCLIFGHALLHLHITRHDGRILPRAHHG